MSRLPLLLFLRLCCAQDGTPAPDSNTSAEASLPHILWRAPNESTLQDWRCGFAGCDHAPAPPFYFVKEDMEGTNPKVLVKDSKGRSWSVKFGGKAITEPFCSRFVTAVGYVVEPSYYVATGKLEGGSRLRRARTVVKPDGSFTSARFQPRSEKDLEFLTDHAWSLVENPFRGSHEFAGLRIIVMLLSNWDTKDARDGQDESNTAVFRSVDSSGRTVLLYSLFDWGSTLGRWGGFRRRTRSDCSGFTRDGSKFIKGVHGATIEWGFEGKHEADITTGITVDDARWLLANLRRITDEEIRTGLKASGATDRQTGCWANAIENRIRQLEAAARSAP